MIVTLAMTLNLKGLLFLIAAIAFGVIVVADIAAKQSDWRRTVGYAGWCLAMVALFIWAAGG